MTFELNPKVFSNFGVQFTSLMLRMTKTGSVAKRCVYVLFVVYALYK